MFLQSGQCLIYILLEPRLGFEARELALALLHAKGHIMHALALVCLGAPETFLCKSGRLLMCHTLGCNGCSAEVSVPDLTKSLGSLGSQKS